MAARLPSSWVRLAVINCYAFKMNRWIYSHHLKNYWSYCIAYFLPLLEKGSNRDKTGQPGQEKIKMEVLSVVGGAHTGGASASVPNYKWVVWWTMDKIYLTGRRVGYIWVIYLCVERDVFLLNELLLSSICRPCFRVGMYLTVRIIVVGCTVDSCSFRLFYQPTKSNSTYIALDKWDPIWCV